MKESVVVCSLEFKAQAQKFISLALTLCERRIEENDYHITPESKALSAAFLSLERAVAAFIATERLLK